MTQDINRVTLSGHLTRDAELRSTQSGMSVLGFGVAVNDRRKNQQTGEWEDFPNFIDCTIFGNRAQGLQPCLLKGKLVFIEGKLRYSSWGQQDGSKRIKLEVIVDDLVLGGNSPQLAQPTQPAQQGFTPGWDYSQYQPPYGQQPQGYQAPPQAQPVQARQAPQPQAYQAPPAQPVQTQIYDDDITF